MIPYSRQIITKDDRKIVNSVLNSDFITQGNMIKKFEKSLASKVRAKFATGFNSATSALHISCLALGVKKGDIVWTCTNSFVASANCGLYCGASIDLVDINSENFNIDVLELEKKLFKAKQKKKLPKVIIPVHFGGLPCDMEKIFALSKKYKFKIVEDASHALGAKYKNNNVGSCKYSDIAVFSFHPVKIITTAEGGAATTNSKILNHRLKLLRNHGITREKKYLNRKKFPSWYYEFKELGYNYRLNEIQAALGLSQLKKLNRWVSYRNKLADIYRRELKNLPINYPAKMKGFYSSYHLFVITIFKNSKTISRNKIFNILKKKGIQANVHYIPIHTHPFFKKIGFKNLNFPKANKYYNSCLTLPLYAGLTKKKQKKIIKILKKILS